MKFKRRVQSMIFFAMSLNLTFASAQIVVQASSAILQPQIGRDQTGFSSCGVRAIVTDSKPGFVDVHDFTLAIRADMPGGLIKAGKSSTSNISLAKGMPKTKAVQPAPVRFWIARESQGKALFPLQVIPADTPGYILESVELGQTLSEILAVSGGQRMQFANRYKNEPVDTVIAFSVELPDAERQPLLTCLDGVIERLKTLSVE